MPDVWRIEYERLPRWWRFYHCVAVASEGGERFRLECGWERPVYYLEVTSDTRGTDDPVFTRLLFSDADCGKYVRQVMRIARRDVAKKLARLDALHQGGLINAGVLGVNCDPVPTAGGWDVEPGREG